MGVSLSARKVKDALKLTEKKNIILHFCLGYYYNSFI